MLLLFIVAAMITVLHISQPADSMAFVTPSQIIFSLLVAAISLPTHRWSGIEMQRMSNSEGSRVRTPDIVLRQYVPDVVARQIQSGRQLKSCECEISVLFADIRGFTSFCEQHTPSEIFRIVNRFTDRLCRIVRIQGGHVIQFNGDGIMAVFGAPNTIPAKERAAVQAGCAILDVMRSMISDSSGHARHLSVGVGIATGTDFVGNIQADRAIWTALGNTTNLASRLQSLTRDLHVAMAIDSATRVAVGRSMLDFEHRRVAIRGRREPQDVYVLQRQVEIEEARQRQTRSFAVDFTTVIDASTRRPVPDHRPPGAPISVHKTAAWPDFSRV